MSLRRRDAAEVSESVEPLGPRILIRKDESRQKTKGGIVLPDNSEIPTITGRVVQISAEVERNTDFPVKKYDKVLFHPKSAIPVDLEADNILYVVPISDVVAVFRRNEKKPKTKVEALEEDLDDLSELSDSDEE
jgi:chaperonin GroES